MRVDIDVAVGVVSDDNGRGGTSSGDHKNRFNHQTVAKECGGDRDRGADVSMGREVAGGIIFVMASSVFLSQSTSYSISCNITYK